MDKHLLIAVASKFLVHKLQSGSTIAPGSPAIREAVELAYALAEDVEKFEDVIDERRQAAEQKAADDERLAAEKAEGAKLAAEAAAQAQLDHDRIEKERAEKKADEEAARLKALADAPK